MRKHIIIVSMAVLFLLSFTACAGYQTDFENVTINYETSKTHTKEDIDNAINAVFDEFSRFSDAELNSLTYSGDEISEENIDYCQELIEDKKIVDCIVLRATSKRQNGQSLLGNQIQNTIGIGMSQRIQTEIGLLQLMVIVK